MPKIIYGGLLKNRIKHSMIENEYNKRIENQAIIANAIAKKDLLKKLNQSYMGIYIINELLKVKKKILLKDE